MSLGNTLRAAIGHYELEDPVNHPSDVLPKMTKERIGIINNGVDGSDEYLLVSGTEDDITIEHVRKWLLPQYHKECNGPGQYYCRDMSAQQVQYRANEVIAVVFHRYDN